MHSALLSCCFEKATNEVKGYKTNKLCSNKFLQINIPVEKILIQYQC